jgi:hypothetical protein
MEERNYRLLIGNMFLGLSFIAPRTLDRILLLIIGMIWVLGGMYLK